MTFLHRLLSIILRRFRVVLRPTLTTFFALFKTVTLATFSRRHRRFCFDVTLASFSKKRHQNFLYLPSIQP